MWRFAIVLIALTNGAARAEDASGCDKFKWSLARERSWFAAGAEATTTGAHIALAERAYSLALSPAENAEFALPLERPAKPRTFGGIVAISLDKPGLYEATLSDQAWIDAIQNGARVKSSNFTEQKDCPGVRKSVRFRLAAGETTLQISNSEIDKIGLTFAPAE